MIEMKTATSKTTSLLNYKHIDRLFGTRYLQRLRKKGPHLSYRSSKAILCTLPFEKDSYQYFEYGYAI